MKEIKKIKWSRCIDSIMDAPVQRVKDFIGGRNNIINLSQGLPWFGPPTEALQNAVERIKKEEANRYSNDEGSYDLRSLISMYLSSKGINSEISNIIVTPGSNQAFFIVLSVIADKGDNIIIMLPYYFNHKMAAQLLGINTIEIPFGENYHIDLDLIRGKINCKTRAIVVISPNNPTGSMIDKSLFIELVELINKHNIYLITDEAYCDFCWDLPYFTPLSIDYYNTIGLFSFSKSFGMSGWRLGFIKCRKELIPHMIKVADTLHICPPVASQILGEEVLKLNCSYASVFRDSIRASRDILIDNLMILYNKGIISKPISEGGYYVFVKFNFNVALIGWELVELLIDKYGIAVMPGEAFGVFDKDIYLRISYGNVKPDEMRKSARKLKDALFEIKY